MGKKRQTVGGPVLFWHSDPVLPDETLMLAGADFTASTVVELELLGGEQGWTEIVPSQWSELCLKAVVPADWAKGVYACRARDGEAVSATVFANAPDVWWKQGEGGVDVALSGSWLRLFGKCLDFDGGARARLSGGPELELEERGCFALRAKLPDGLPPGDYQVELSNGQGGESGWRPAGALAVKTSGPDNRPVFNVLNYGADPTGMKDCSGAFDTAIILSHGHGGGIVYAPRGRYRIDGTMRPGFFMDSPLLLPENVSLRGEGAELTSLWWPTRERPLPMLVECRRGCSVEDLALYAQGPLLYGITGDSDVVLKNLLVRLNPYYMTRGPGKAHHGHLGPENGGAPAICLLGENNRVLGCDILVASTVLDIRGGRGSVIAGNTFRGGGTHSLNFCAELVYENNNFEGSLLAGGGNIALHFGGYIAKHVYYANNRTRHLYTGDHECLTFDGHAGAYVGRVEDVVPDSFTLAEALRPPVGQGAINGTLLGTAVYIVDGRGAGQWRFLSDHDPKTGRVVVDRPWDVPPDGSSLVSIAGFNGRHIILNNRGEDVGTLVQLYPTNCECLVVGNQGVRASNINSLSAIGCFLMAGDPGKLTRMEVSWYNQFLDNEILVGNGWGGGKTEVDGWLGGESTLQLHARASCFFRFDADGKRLPNDYITPEWLATALGEDKPRDFCVPPSRFQVVRRHVVHNNSSIRVRGAVADTVVEHCRLAHSRLGVRVDLELRLHPPTDMREQLFDYDPAPSAETPAMPFFRPTGVLARRNYFEDVQIPYSGTALEHAKIEC